jgi:hypothetical protein
MVGRVTLPATDDRPSQGSIDTSPGALDSLVADCAEVTRHLAEVPPQRRVITIPEQAVAMVAGLGSYGD